MNSIGRYFRIALFGESHGETIGIIVDGVKAGIKLSAEDFTTDLSRRKPGKEGTTGRIEDDIPRIVSGVYNGFTTGAPISILFDNHNVKSRDYDFIREFWRPGHADFPAEKKFGGFNDPRGGGHFSGRLTLSIVAAGVIAKKVLHGVTIESKILQIHGSANWENEITIAKQRNDSVGGIVECRVDGLPVGLGEPFFDSVESVISHIIFSIPAIKGIEFGSGFASALMYGSEFNDVYLDADGHTLTNHSGGVLGGLSTGNSLIFRVAVKPTSSIGIPQTTYNKQSGNIESLTLEGRHDTCIVLRVPVVLEAATAIALADLWLAQ
ncbi:MAG TPA: chorismate synthase [Salinivirgaceae bacterium]|nr:chorismate synthase [Salinivirgaceae bacterium]